MTEESEETRQAAATRIQAIERGIAARRRVAYRRAGGAPDAGEEGAAPDAGEEGDSPASGRSSAVSSGVPEIGDNRIYVAALTDNTAGLAELLATDAAQHVWRDSIGCSALHRACRVGHSGSARLLIAAYPDVNIRDRAGWTPLHHACSTGRYECALILCESGADVNLVNERGNTALHLALMGGRDADVFKKCQRLLMKHGASTGPPRWIMRESRHSRRDSRHSIPPVLLSMYGS